MATELGRGTVTAGVDLSATLRDLRWERGIRQVDVARRLGVHPSVVWHWERGSRRVPADRVEALAAVVGVPRRELLGQRSVGPTKRRRSARGWTPWAPDEEARLRELLGRHHVAEVQAILERETGVRRSVPAIRCHAERMGCSSWWDGWSQHSVGELAGVTEEVARHWIQEGLLGADRWPGPGRGLYGQWHVSAAQLDTFLRTHPWAYDWRRFRPGRWRSLAEVVYRADPWLTLEEAARAMGRGRTSLSEWVVRGLVPHRRRRAGAGRPKVMIRAAQLEAIDAGIRAAALANARAARARRVWRKRARGAQDTERRSAAA